MSAAGIRHLYVHVPFCAHRCGYCDFVTVTGHEDERGRYVDALIAELGRARPSSPRRSSSAAARRRSWPTPTSRACSLRSPLRGEVTVECNPETITRAKAQVLVEGGVTRVSLGAQSFRPHLLDVLERRARPEQIAAAVGAAARRGRSKVSTST